VCGLRVLSDFWRRGEVSKKPREAIAGTVSQVIVIVVVV
jgi:hypothetical protein